MNIYSGEVSGSTSAKRLPFGQNAKMVKFRANPDNTGSVYLGGEGVTVPDGTNNKTGGWPLAPGEETGWFVDTDLHDYYIVCDSAADSLHWLVVN